MDGPAHCHNPSFDSVFEKQHMSKGGAHSRYKMESMQRKRRKRSQHRDRLETHTIPPTTSVLRIRERISTQDVVCCFLVGGVGQVQLKKIV